MWRVKPWTGLKAEMELISSSDCLARLEKGEFCYGLAFHPFAHLPYPIPFHCGSVINMMAFCPGLMPGISSKVQIISLASYFLL